VEVVSDVSRVEIPGAKAYWNKVHIIKEATE
jgi:hypothetical protein